MRVLVTGGGGLVGHNLVKRLAKSQYDVHTTYHSKPFVVKNVNAHFINLCNLDDCDYLIRTIKPSVVYHCAAQSFGAEVMSKNPLALVNSNIIMNVNLMEACYANNVKNFIWLASTTGYPESNDEVTEDMMFKDDPFDKYFGVGWCKRYTEKLCELYATKLDKPMNCIVLRPTNIYGPHDKYDFDRCHVLPALIRRFAEKQNPLDLWGEGKETRDFIYVDDMVDAICKATDIKEFTQINIGSGTQHSIMDVISILKEVSGHNPDINVISGKPSMISSRRVSIEKAKKVMNFEATTSLKDGLEKTLNWYQEYYL